MNFDVDALRRSLKAHAPAAQHVSLRAVAEFSKNVSVRQDVAEPIDARSDIGVMVTVVDGDGIGYASTSDLSDAGVRQALGRAHDWARQSRGRSVFAGTALKWPRFQQSRTVPSGKPMTWTKAERIALLMTESQAARRGARIVDWIARLWTIRSESLMLSAAGDEARQSHDHAIPSLEVTAHDGGVTQSQPLGGRYNGFCQPVRKRWPCWRRPTARVARWTWS